uniref:Bidirectional sugar transporter SWEET n=1 Tax=Ananas comosus var. bracteatus TaxID=296719 RepID=A0A6V7P1C8_ANACO|nr:unnamed protein product [Ananas comosus var. bracteatus]
MAVLSLHHPWAFTFGILGNIISLMVYLAPLPTFYRVYKKKSTEGFQSIPYIIALFSSMLWIYYAFLKPDASLLITINSIGCAIEAIYIITYLVFAPKNAKLPNVLGFLFGIMQMVLYVAYKDVKPITQEYKLPEKGLGVHPVDSKPSKIENEDHHIVIEGDPKRLDDTEATTRKKLKRGIR